MVDIFSYIIYYSIAFAHGQDRATLGSDPSGPWGFTGRSGVSAPLFFLPGSETTPAGKPKR